MTSKFFYPAKVLLEPGGYRKIISEAPQRFKRLFVVTGKSSMHRAGLLDALESICRESDVALEICTGIKTNPEDDEVDAVAAKLNAFQADAVLGLGGGSSIDAAKIIAMLATNGGNSADYLSLNGTAKKITEKPLPIFAIPTTSGAASEATPFAVITHGASRMKKGMGSPLLYPSFVIIDPKLLALMPRDLIALTGFDAFGQALEGFTSRNSTFHSEYFGFSSLRLILDNFEKSWLELEDVTAKAQMAWGTFNSGLSIGLVDVNLAHAMSHPLSGHFGLHHGLAVALCTVQSIRFNRGAVGHKYVEVGRLISNRVRSDEAAIDLLIDKILQWFDLFKIKPALKDYDVPESALQTLTRDALQIGAIRTNPKPVEETQLLELFYKVWHGETS